MGPQLLLEASLFSRIGTRGDLFFWKYTNFLPTGLTHAALLQCDIFRECYAQGSPLEDKLKITYRSSQLVSIT